MAEDSKQPTGATPQRRRKDGKPYAEGNTREDGSYKVGKNHPPKATQFAKNDGRKRGRRAKGTRNLQTDFAEELAEMVTLTENGVRIRTTKGRMVVKSVCARAARSSDRAADIVFRYAMQRDDEAPKLRMRDEDVISAWLKQRGAAEQALDTDDSDAADVAGPTDEADDADQ